MKKRMNYFAILIALVMAIATIPQTETLAASKKKLTVSSSKMTMNVKQTKQLKVKYGKTNVTKKATYKSSNKKIVTVTKKGKITAKKAGTANITIKYKGKKKTVKVTVNKVKKPTKTTPEKHVHEWEPQVAHNVRKCTANIKVCNCGKFETVYYTGPYKKSYEVFGLLVENGNEIKKKILEGTYVPEPGSFFYHQHQHALNHEPSNYMTIGIWEEYEYVYEYHCKCGAVKEVPDSVLEKQEGKATGRMVRDWDPTGKYFYGTRTCGH